MGRQDAQDLLILELLLSQANDGCRLSCSEHCSLAHCSFDVNVLEGSRTSIFPSRAEVVRKEEQFRLRMRNSLSLVQIIAAPLSCIGIHVKTRPVLQAALASFGLPCRMNHGVVARDPSYHVRDHGSGLCFGTQY
jgi:hypothetical protein